MRKINTLHFHRATRSTPREINRLIVLNLVREHQPISRADLARRMRVGRGMVTSLIDELLGEGVIYEGATGDAPRGRKPKLLHLRTHDRFAIAIDVRFSRTYVMLADFAGRPLDLDTLSTPLQPGELVAALAERVRRLLRVNGVVQCEGIGVVVPGMVDRRTGRVLNSPQLGWHDVEVRDQLSAATGLPVHIENAPAACALARMWLAPRGHDGVDNFVYVSVSDGLGTGVVVNGEVMGGSTDTAGEFGHIPLNVEGPLCVCGRRGCWEAYASNLATLARYFELDLSLPETRSRLRDGDFGIPELIDLARSGDERALEALQQSARYLGLGLANVISALNPARIVLGGEITAIWDLIEPTVRTATASRALTEAAAATPFAPEGAQSYPRLRGATALVVAPLFAAPEIA